MKALSSQWGYCIIGIQKENILKKMKHWMI